MKKKRRDNICNSNSLFWNFLGIRNDLKHEELPFHKCMFHGILIAKTFAQRRLYVKFPL